MDTALTPIEDLKPAFERLRAAHLAHIPSYGERIAALERLEQAVRRHSEELVAACSADFGRRAPLETLGSDVLVSLDEIKHARKHLRRWMKSERRAVNLSFLPARGEVRYAPLGVVGIVAPWNYPFQLVIVPLANAIAAGNRIMIKPSEFTPSVQALLMRMLGEIFSADEVLVVHGDHALSAAFTRLPFDHLLFTGSTAVGRLVMEAAAANLTPVTLELGGKCPAVIAPGYPIEHAADRIAFGKCFNGGQTCVAPDYVLVPRAQRDAFVTAYMASLKRRYPTLADNPDYTVTVNARQADRLRAWLADARQRGVEVLQYAPAGETVPAGLELIPPTVLLDPPDDAMVMREEIFGPLLPVCSYDEYDQAIAQVLRRDKPLAFYTFDKDQARSDRTLDRVSAGMACVNDVLIQFGQNEFPIGGVGASGMGCYHGHAGFLTFSKTMPVLYQSRVNGMKLFDAPYSNLAKKMVGWLTR
ncbi:MAG: coniferyl aldehyde dehydrogenase [Arenimonas sp.]|nr:coniferyl aldehyde dehydrogenase [Arenimonas sp.]